MSMADASIVRLLRSNDIPTDEDIPNVLNAIDYYQADLDRLAEAIHHAELLLSDLQKRKSSVQKAIRRHKAIISPVRRLPAELLCEIARFSDEVETEWVTDTSYRKSVWSMAETCRSWRHSICLCPTLWSQIAVNGALVSRDALPKVLRRVQLLLERSAKVELDVSYRFSHVRPADTFESAMEVWKLLAQSSSRWKSATLVFYSMVYADFQLLDDLSALQCLRLEIVSTPSSHSTGVQSISAFKNARKLYEVALRLPRPPRDTYMLDLPWQQIRKWTEERLNPDESLAYLRQLTMLSDYSVGSLSSSTSVVPYYGVESGPTVTANFRTLSLVQHTRLLPYFHRLVAPNLEGISASLPEHSENISALESFIRRSNCCITVFSISDSMSSGLISLLRHMPTLHTLEFHDCVFDSFILSKLDITGVSEEDILLPGLTELRLVRVAHDGREGTSLDLTTFVKAILDRSRHPSVASLESLTFLVHRYTTEDSLRFHYSEFPPELAPLQALGGEGLVLNAELTIHNTPAEELNGDSHFVQDWLAGANSPE